MIFTAPSVCGDCNEDVTVLGEACGMGMNCKRYRKRLEMLFQVSRAAAKEKTPWGEALKSCLDCFEKAGDR